MRFWHETFSRGLSDSHLEREVGDPASELLPRVLDGWLRKGCVPQLLGPAGAGHTGHDFGYLAAHGPSEIKTNNEIGLILEISATTAKNHIQKILRKLNVSNRAQAVGRGVALHLLAPGE